MRALVLAIALLFLVSTESPARADYGLWIVTPENLQEVGGLKVEATTGPTGMIRFVVRREGKEARGHLKGLLRLKVAENVWTEAYVAADAPSDATEYRFAVAPAHLDIATFNVILTEGLGGEWYEIRLKEFVSKGEPADATEGSPQPNP